jgi:cysteine synthase A
VQQVRVGRARGLAFAVGWGTLVSDAPATLPPVIEGIGRPRAEPGFLYDVVDRVVEVDDARSIDAMRRLESLLGQRYGGSSGTNFAACVQLADEMRDAGERGSVVSLLCDRGERYAQTLYAPDWLAAHGLGAAVAG